MEKGAVVKVRAPGLDAPRHVGGRLTDDGEAAQARSGVLFARVQMMDAADIETIVNEIEAEKEKEAEKKKAGGAGAARSAAPAPAARTTSVVGEQ